MIIKTALISVSDKTDITNIAKVLYENNVKIISTGGTFKTLKDNNINAINLSDYTNFPEIMNGRVKTLHPKIHGGILYRKNIDKEIMESYNISAIDLVIVNLYPFNDMVKKNLELDELIEFIDIGGPSLLRASAKNYKNIITICDYKDYNIIIKSINNKTLIHENIRFKLACKVFNHTAQYDGLISNTLNKVDLDNKTININNNYPNILNIQLEKKKELRYGENPHQRAAIYHKSNFIENNLNKVTTSLQGKDLSYNNILDSEIALRCVKMFKQSACVIVKHGTPCGAAICKDINNAYNKAFTSDPNSAFGGIIAFNKKIDLETLKNIINKQFVEILISPDIDKEALNLLSGKKNIRYIKYNPEYNMHNENKQELKTIIGGEFLLQDEDLINSNIKNDELTIATAAYPSQKEMEDLRFGWIIAKFVKSNAIVLVKDKVTIGIGGGQTSRIDSCNIAINKSKKYGFNLLNSSLASDAFFPFVDVVEISLKEGIKSIIQPGGSINDKKIIEFADLNKISMIMTGIRHFKH